MAVIISSIQKQYDREISYRIARNRIRDAIAVYLLEKHVDFIEDWEERELVLDMMQRTKGFLSEDYDRIMRNIKHKINIYLQIAVGRARFLKSKETDVRGCVEQALRYLAEKMELIGWKELRYTKKMR